MTPEDIVWELRRLADGGNVHPYALRQLADRIELGGLLGRPKAIDPGVQRLLDQCAREDAGSPPGKRYLHTQEIYHLLNQKPKAKE